MPFRWLSGVPVPNASLLRVKGSKPQTGATHDKASTLRRNGGIIGGSTKRKQGNSPLRYGKRIANMGSMKPTRRSTLEKHGLTFDHIEEVARFYHLNTSTVWRYAVGKLPLDNVNPGMLKSMLRFGWQPKDGLAYLAGVLYAKDKTMPHQE